MQEHEGVKGKEEVEGGGGGSIGGAIDRPGLVL